MAQLVVVVFCHSDLADLVIHAKTLITFENIFSFFMNVINPHLVHIMPVTILLCLNLSFIYIEERLHDLAGCYLSQ
jgi:hypothetical protein